MMFVRSQLRYCVYLCLITISVCSISPDDGSNDTNITSTYQEQCCEVENYGKSFVLSRSNGATISIIMCPTTRPVGCPLIHGTSCLDISDIYPGSSSGFYNITLYNGSVISVYCDMEGDNCDGEGGWTRVGYINMTESGATCPSDLQLQYNNDLGHDACAKNNVAFDGCNSVYFSTNGLNYSEICGQARGYTDHGHGFHSYLKFNASVNSYYVDGISITIGNPRYHIWTYAAGDNNFVDDPEYSYECPCSNQNTFTVPDSVGGNYYCEGTYYQAFSGPLWDGKNCTDEESTCCSYPKMPWFMRSLDEETNEDIEVRLCANDHCIMLVDILELFLKKQ